MAAYYVRQADMKAKALAEQVADRGDPAAN